ncbi:MAG: membrane protein [Rhodomicrobium sp.]|nr:MAG: membrane protein [Rhodomicrobium sp.]
MRYLRALSKFLLPSLIGLTLIIAGQSLPARADGVITDLTSDKVPIEWNFTGANIFLFGAIEGEIRPDNKPDVIVVVKGPEKPLIARKKERIAGVWVNTNPKKVTKVPLYYSVASSRPLRDIAPASLLDGLGIGFEALVGQLTTRFNVDDTKAAERYAEAVVRLMEHDGLYKTGTAGVKIVGDRLFQVNISLEANVPSGAFTADVFLFRGGKLIGRRATELTILKSGFERLVFEFAFDYPFFYGVIAVILALIAGFAATALFRKD